LNTSSIARTPVAHDPDRRRFESQEKFPGNIRAAAIIWTIIGGFTLLFSLLPLALAIPGEPEYVPTAIAIAVVAGVFLFAAFRTVRGRAWEALAYGIGSVLLSVPMILCGSFFGLGCLQTYVEYVQGRRPRFSSDHGLFTPELSVIAGILLAVGAGLLVAGVLAIRARGRKTGPRK
jgi:hypothetical protein